MVFLHPPFGGKDIGTPVPDKNHAEFFDFRQGKEKRVPRMRDARE
jgi:hypothetical protein